MTTPTSLKKAMEREARSRKRKASTEPRQKPQSSGKPTISTAALDASNVFGSDSEAEGCCSSDSSDDAAPPPLHRRLSLKKQISHVHRTLDDTSVGKFYAVFFDSKYYYGKVLNLNDDSDSGRKNVEFTFLHDDRTTTTNGFRLFVYLAIES